MTDKPVPSAPSTPKRRPRAAGLHDALGAALPLQRTGEEPGGDGTAGTTQENAPPAPGSEAESRTFRTRVALLIAACSIAGVLAAWQASVQSNHAFSLEQQGLQQLIQKQQELNKIRGLTDQDARLAALYEEHMHARELLEEAAIQNPALAESLRLEAREQHTLARALRRFFLTYQPGGDEDFEAREAVQDATYRGQALRELHPDSVLARAEDAQTHAVWFEGLTALFAVSLFLLTLAELARSGVRRYFALSGGTIVGAGLVMFAVAKVLAP